jgi:formylglycine-generating enzyme required for sulfatase activity
MEITASVPLVGALPPGTELHEYRIERVLGHGGFGITYLARDVNLDKKVAIKEYLPNDLATRGEGLTVALRTPDSGEHFRWGMESFIKEARVLGKFAHESLAQVHRYFEANRTAYFVMEYVEGATLARVLKREGTINEDRLRKILFPLLDGLEEVHRLGVLHRDIKPDNIILRADAAAPVLIDFGAARQNLSSMTRSVMSVLTAGYAPIEQYATSGNQGPWTDLYAMGAVAYRALSGKRPIDAVNRIRDDPLVPAAEVGRDRYTPHFLAAVDWALAVNGEDRPQSVGDFKRALDGKMSPPQPPSPAARLAAGAAAGPEAIVEPTMILERAAPLAPGAGEDDRRRPAWIPWAGFGAAAAMLVAAALYFALGREPRSAGVPQPRTPAADAVAPAAQETAKIEAPPSGPAPKPAPASAPEPAAAAPAKAAVARPAAPVRTRVTPVAAMQPLKTFQDCPHCPVMVVLPAGAFLMGARPEDIGNTWEQPAHRVTLAAPFAIGRHEVTRAQWQACVAAGACPAVKAGPGVADPAKAPVVHVSWTDAQAYAAWLGATTGRSYRLPTEAEWEYAIRAGTTGARYWEGDRTQQCRYGNGADASALKANPKLQVVECDDGHAALAPIGSFQPNAFGLHDMAGNAWEWTRDCWRDRYAAAPGDGRAFEPGACDRRVIRGGSWLARPNSLRSFGRGNSAPDLRSEDLGLRVVAR